MSAEEWSWNPDDTDLDDEPWWETEAEDEPTPAEEIEAAVARCGRVSEASAWCAHGGTEYCMFQCPFRSRDPV